ncbi:MAG: spore maturation protein [Candidatus Azobacteroides sp.]|nr:spore maturation protein [Candidatus Azobacteroides sp.]
MVLNYIWIGFFVVAFIVAIFLYLFTGDTEVFKRIIDSTFDASKMAVMDVALPLTGVMTLWLGLMNIGEKAGAVNFLARIVGPFFNRLFPDIPKNHPASGQLLMNFSANMLGLDNAATPLGLKAMNSLQELNLNKETASNAQIMFLVLNTSGLTLIPISIIAQRAILGAANPTDVFIPILIATVVSSLVGLIYVAFKQKINLADPVILAWLCGIIAFIGGIILLFDKMPKERVETISKVASNLILLIIIIGFIVGALIKKVNAYEAFIDGAKEGFSTMIKVIPYLVGMLVGIAVFRASGAMDYLIDGLAWCFKAAGLNTDFVPALPTAFMKPLSGSGARAMMIESMSKYGADSFVGRLSCLFQGAADTTFYIVALYFGSVGIKRTRYAIQGGLIADLAGVVTAVIIAYLFFG